MRVKIKILSGGVKEQVNDVLENSTYEDLLDSLDINPETVIVLCRGTPVPFDERVTGDDVEILRVVSGG